MRPSTTLDRAGGEIGTATGKLENFAGLPNLSVRGESCVGGVADRAVSAETINSLLRFCIVEDRPMPKKSDQP